MAGREAELQLLSEALAVAGATEGVREAAAVPVGPRPVSEAEEEPEAEAAALLLPPPPPSVPVAAAEPEPLPEAEAGPALTEAALERLAAELCAAEAERAAEGLPEEEAEAVQLDCPCVAEARGELLLPLLLLLAVALAGCREPLTVREALPLGLPEAAPL